MMNGSSETQNQKYGKKSKPSDSEGEDRISNFPDAILCHILSFMPTKYAVRSSLLSTRWKLLWPSVPTIELCSYTRGDHKDESSVFMDFVDRVFLLHNNIDKFHLKCQFGYYNTYRLNSWICTAIKLNVQEIVLDLVMELPVELPRSLFTSINLVVLKLYRDVGFGFPMPVFLPSLKILHLRFLGFLDDDSFNNLLSGCPVLEELDIKRYTRDNIKTLCICSSTLKKLHISNTFCKEPSLQYKVVINVPVLEMLMLDDYLSEVFDVNECPSLVKAILSVSLREFGDEINDDFCNGVVRMLRNISNVQNLRLCDRTLKVIIQSPTYKLLLFPNLTHLRMRIHGSEWSIFPDLLDNMPNLKVLVFEKDRDICLWPSAPKNKPKCLSLCLETIEGDLLAVRTK